MAESDTREAPPEEQDALEADDGQDGGAATDDAALLWPEREVELRDGRTIVVREMTWAQSMRLAKRWRPIADALFETIRRGRDAEDIDPDDVVAIFEDHGEAALELLAACTDLDPGEIEQLPLDDGQLLLVTWLGIHLGFFGRRLRLGAQLAAGLREGMDRARQAAGPSATSS